MVSRAECGQLGAGSAAEVSGWCAGAVMAGPPHGGRPPAVPEGLHLLRCLQSGRHAGQLLTPISRVAIHMALYLVC